jgi:hypothetical protein
MLARRLLIALAVLMAITALAAGLAPRESALRDGDQAATPGASAAVPAPEPVEEVLDAQAEGQSVEAEVGQIVRITVRSADLQTVSLEDTGIETAEPDSPAIFELLADVPGSYAIDLLDPERRIGTLEISERER